MSEREHDRFARRLSGRGNTGKPVAAPDVEIHEETSEAYEDPDARREWRARRGTIDRLDRVEVKVDSVVPALARLEGKVDTLIDLQKSDADRKDKAAGRADRLGEKRMTSREKIALALIGAFGTVATAYLIGRGAAPVAPAAPHFAPPAQLGSAS